MVGYFYYCRAEAALPGWSMGSSGVTSGHQSPVKGTSEMTTEGGKAPSYPEGAPASPPLERALTVCSLQGPAGGGT